MEALLGFEIGFWDYVTFASISVIVMGGLNAAIMSVDLKAQPSAWIHGTTAKKPNQPELALRGMVVELQSARRRICR